MNTSITDDRERTHLQVWDTLPWIVNGTASDAARRAAEAHLCECEHCREELARQQRVYAAMNAVTSAEAPLERGLDRLLQKVQAYEQQPGRGAPAADGAVRRRWAMAAYGLAAMVLLEAGGLVVLGMQLGGSHPSVTYRTLSSLDTALPPASIRLVVDPSMTVGKLQALLVSLHLQIVGGPSEDGVYSLGSLDRGRSVESDVTALRAASGVRFVEPVGAMQ
jgi:hypothetical protein